MKIVYAFDRNCVAGAVYSIRSFVERSGFDIVVYAFGRSDEDIDAIRALTEIDRSRITVIPAAETGHCPDRLAFKQRNPYFNKYIALESDVLVQATEPIL